MADSVSLIEPLASSDQKIFRFGVYEADLRTGELRKFGVRLKLQKQPFLVLAVLLERPGDIVTRQELQASICSTEGFVDCDNVLNTAIAKLRSALSDDSSNPRFVETVARLGYRFISPVTVVAFDDGGAGVQDAGTRSAALPATAEAARPAAGLPLRPRWVSPRIASVMVGLVALAGLSVLLRIYLSHHGGRWRGGSGQQIRSLAVLPLENISSDPDQDYFADGMTDELITNLAKIKSLRVISRTSVMRFKKTTIPLPEIARELNVDAVIEGSVTRVGDKVRIRAQLINAAQDEHLWAASYESTLRDILGVQEEMAQKIADRVQIELTPQEQRSIGQLPRPVVPQAYEAYLKGRYYFYQWTAEGFKKSCPWFEETIKLDPSYPLGYSGMADCYSGLTSAGLQPATIAMPKARAMAQKALELDDTLADAHGALGTILLNYDWNWPAAYAELQKAIELNPSNLETRFRLASYFRTVGDIKRAAQELQLAQKLDPVSFRAYSKLGWLYLYAGRYDDAEAYLREGVELGPDYPYDYIGLFKVYDHKKDYPQALAELQKFLAIQKLTAIAEGVDKMYRRHGYQSAKRYYFEQYLAQDIKKNAIPFFLASDYASLDNKEKALDYLELAYRERSNYMNQLKMYSYFDNVRSEPRFQHLLKELNLQ